MSTNLKDFHLCLKTLTKLTCALAISYSSRLQLKQELTNQHHHRCLDHQGIMKINTPMECLMNFRLGVSQILILPTATKLILKTRRFFSRIMKIIIS